MSPKVTDVVRAAPEARACAGAVVKSQGKPKLVYAKGVDLFRPGEGPLSVFSVQTGRTIADKEVLQKENATSS